MENDHGNFPIIPLYNSMEQIWELQHDCVISESV